MQPNAPTSASSMLVSSLITPTGYLSGRLDSEPNPFEFSFSSSESASATPSAAISVPSSASSLDQPSTRENAGVNTFGATSAGHHARPLVGPSSWSSFGFASSPKPLLPLPSTLGGGAGTMSGNGPATSTGFSPMMSPRFGSQLMERLDAFPFPNVSLPRPSQQFPHLHSPGLQYLATAAAVESAAVAAAASAAPGAVRSPGFSTLLRSSSSAGFGASSGAPASATPSSSSSSSQLPSGQPPLGMAPRAGQVVDMAHSSRSSHPTFSSPASGGAVPSAQLGQNANFGSGQNADSQQHLPFRGDSHQNSFDQHGEWRLHMDAGNSARSPRLRELTRLEEQSKPEQEASPPSSHATVSSTKSPLHAPRSLLPPSTNSITIPGSIPSLSSLFSPGIDPDSRTGSSKPDEWAHWPKIVVPHDIEEQHSFNFGDHPANTDDQFPHGHGDRPRSAIFGWYKESGPNSAVENPQNVQAWPAAASETVDTHLLRRHGMTSQPASVFARPSYIASQPHLQSHAVSAAASLPSRYSPVPRYPGSRAPSASPAPSNASLQSAGSTIKRTSKQSAAPEHSRSIHSPAISRRQTSHHLIPLPEPVPPRPSRPHKQPQHAQQQPPPAYHHQEQHRQQQGASDGSPGMVEAPAPVSVSPSGSDREDQTAAGHGDEGEDSARDFIPVAKIESIAPDPPAKRPAQRRSTRAAPSPAAKAGGGSKKRNAAAAAAAAAAEFEDDAERDEDDDDDEDDEKEKISPAEAARRQQERAKAEGFDLTDPAQRKRWLLLERNRRAAQKCRQRKKVRIQGLQGSIDKLAQDNAELMEQAVALREQVLHLKSLLLANRDCPVASGNGIDFQAIESTLTTTLRSIY